MRRHGQPLLLATLAVAGCVEPPFSPHARDNSLVDFQRVSPRLGAPAKAGRPTAYLVTSGEKHLVSYDLEGGKVSWDVRAEVTSRLAIGRGFVAEREGDAALAVRSASDGRLRCNVALPAGELLLGLAADDRVYFATETKAGDAITRRRTLAAADPTSCAVLWRDEAHGSLGAPAARGGVVAAPYAHQNVALLDGATGAELARIRAKEDEISFVSAAPEGFFYGSMKGIYLLDDASVSGTRRGSHYAEAHLASDQFRTFYYWDAYQPTQLEYTAFDRNRLQWRAALTDGGRALAFRDDTAYLHSYRYFVAFDARSGLVRWAYAHPRVDVVGSSDDGPCILFASVDGEIGALDAKTGVLTWSKKTGLKVAGVTFDADGFAPAPAAAGVSLPVEKTLAQIVWDPDARFTAMKVFAIDAMAKVPSAEVTQEILKVVLKEGVAPAVSQKAAEVLVARKDAASVGLYREALARRYDYLNDVQPRAVAVLARVLAAVDDKASVPLLAAHLLDPTTPPATLKEVVRALVVLGGKEAIPPLRDLLLVHRCDVAFQNDPVALQLAGEGLLKLGGPEERRVVSFIAEEPRTLDPLARHLAATLAGETPPPPAPVAPTAKKTISTPKAAAKPPAAPPPATPPAAATTPSPLAPAAPAPKAPAPKAPGK